MDPVNVRRDEISATKQELIRWVEDYLGPVALYTKVNLANKIKLILPDTGQKNILIKIYIICFLAQLKSPFLDRFLLSVNSYIVYLYTLTTFQKSSAPKPRV